MGALETLVAVILGGAVVFADAQTMLRRQQISSAGVTTNYPNKVVQTSVCFSGPLRNGRDAEQSPVAGLCVPKIR